MWSDQTQLSELSSLIFYGWVENTQPIYKSMIIWLVVEPPLWEIWESLGLIIPNIWKNKKCSKPPTSYVVGIPSYKHNWYAWAP